MKNILLYILLLICLKTFAQPYDQKFGKISMAEMEMKVCPIDSSAAAVFLFDIGETRFDYNMDKSRFQLLIIRHARVKILSKDGLSWADLSLTLFNENDFEEKLASFKGFTFNLENGKIVKEKVEKSAIFREKKDERRTGVKITFPKVVEGSILEFDYEITSDYTYNLQPWDFQYSIPVLFSQYSIGIPEYYSYKTHISGYEPISVKDEVNYRSIYFNTQERSGGTSLRNAIVKSQTSRAEVKYTEQSKIFTAQNIPGVDDESFVDNLDNYLTKVNFELAWVRYPGQLQENFSTSWAEVSKKLLDERNFGKQLDNGSYLEDDLKAFIGTAESPEEKLAKTVSFIKSRIKWNDKFRLYTENGVKAAYKEGVGNSSEVNLNLVVALRQAGLEAYPVALSTRFHGLVMDWQVTVSGFNHVIAYVKIGEKFYNCDATAPCSMLGLLPTECLNGKARIIDLKNGAWLDLYPKTTSKKSVFAILKVDENNAVTGSVSSTYKDYFALSMAETIKGDDSLKHRKEALIKSFNNSTIDSLKVKIDDNGIAVAKESYNIRTDGTLQENTSIIYLSPMSGFGFGKNPFLKVERKFPVNFTFPRDESVIVRYTFPNGYKIEELPTNISMSMPEGKAKFVITYQVSGNDLVVVSKINIPNTLYLSDDYPALRGFFDEIIKKQNEKVVLTKI
ncbi:MAG: DUF3857 domain-containing protein [Bacteroidales bacterium]|nr:DUF3857 domain-containing protein [Bacteroidales bacterium]